MDSFLASCDYSTVIQDEGACNIYQVAPFLETSPLLNHFLSLASQIWKTTLFCRIGHPKKNPVKNQQTSSTNSAPDVLPTQWQLQKVHRNTVEADVHPWVAAYKDTPDVEMRWDTRSNRVSRSFRVAGEQTCCSRAAQVAYNGLVRVDKMCPTSCFGGGRRAGGFEHHLRDLFDCLGLYIYI